MSTPDIQYFPASGTWHKPPRAIRADIVLQAVGGGSSIHVIADGLQGGVHLRPGRDGKITVQSIPASQLPDEVTVEVGKRGWPDGQDGYALVITHQWSENNA